MCQSVKTSYKCLYRYSECKVVCVSVSVMLCSFISNQFVLLLIKEELKLLRVLNRLFFFTVFIMNVCVR